VSRIAAAREPTPKRDLAACPMREASFAQPASTSTHDEPERTK
jgi:hypothetical protein